MNNDDENEKQANFNQWAWIVNYQPTIHEQHIHMGGTPSVEENGADAPVTIEDAEVVEEDMAADTGITPEVVVNCFNFPNGFTRERVISIVKAFYQGGHADLALIEVALFDHGQLKKRNAHSAFIRSLVAWKIIHADEDELIRIINGVKDKYKHLPIKGYREWGDILLNEKNRCEEIGKMLGPTMSYQRQMT